MAERTIGPVDHLAFLDGMRGLLALWVFIFHAAVYAGYRTDLIPPGTYAVDIFMLLSGFLMAKTLGSATSLFGTMAFYVRRFFRIAPLYYVALLFSLAFAFPLAEMKEASFSTFPPAWYKDLPEYTFIPPELAKNVFLHTTFLFGIFPSYASNNSLPDWSLSLEMQFYALVPFILIAIRRIGVFWVVLALATINYLTLRYVGLYLEPKLLGLWPQPSFIPFRINCFMVGILIFLYVRGESSEKTLLAVLILVLCSWQQPMLFVLAAAVCLLVASGASLQPLAYAKSILQSRALRFLGDLSYAVYLLHMFAILPISAALVETDFYTSLPEFHRFAVLTIASSAIVFPLAFAAHRYIELPGIAFGRSLSSKVAKRPT